MSIVTTYLEISSPDQLRPKRCVDPRFQISEKKKRDWRFNRDLYLAVGRVWSWNVTSKKQHRSRSQRQLRKHSPAAAGELSRQATAQLACDLASSLPKNRRIRGNRAAFYW
jgi:hypothetical protein